MAVAGRSAEGDGARGEFCLLLARSRTLAGLTQEELAQAAGISLRALGDMERGRTRGPQRQTVQALSAALRLDPEQAAALEQAAQAGRSRRTPSALVADNPDGGSTGTVNGAGDGGGAVRAGTGAPSALALPRDIADFTARQDALARLHDLARDPEPAHPRIVLVCGQPGLGKTAFALHTAHSLARLFPDGQLSLDLLGMAPAPLSPRDALAQLLRALGVPDASVPAATEERAGLYRSLVRERRLILVLDNAADEAQVRPLLPGAGPALTLVTSRHRLPGPPRCWPASPARNAPPPSPTPPASWPACAATCPSPCASPGSAWPPAPSSGSANWSANSPPRRTGWTPWKPATCGSVPPSASPTASCPRTPGWSCAAAR
jgi:DNA-binding XRE family transcriptional regulator